jgi:hypothetical protein
MTSMLMSGERAGNRGGRIHEEKTSRQPQGDSKYVARSGLIDGFYYGGGG